MRKSSWRVWGCRGENTHINKLRTLGNFEIYVCVLIVFTCRCTQWCPKPNVNVLLCTFYSVSGEPYRHHPFTVYFTHDNVAPTMVEMLFIFQYIHICRSSRRSKDGLWSDEQDLWSYEHECRAHSKLATAHWNDFTLDAALPEQYKSPHLKSIKWAAVVKLEVKKLNSIK